MKAASQVNLRVALGKWGEEPGYIRALQQRAGSLNVKRLLGVKENQISQAKRFSTFLCMGRSMSLPQLKSFLWYALHLHRASILYFHNPSLRRAPYREWLQCDGRYTAGIPSFLSSLPAQQLTIGGGCNCWWMWHPSFTDTAGNIPFLSTTKCLLIQCLRYLV